MRDAVAAVSGENDEITRMLVEKMQKPPNWVLWRQTNLRHLYSQLTADRWRRFIRVQQVPLLESMTNMGKTVLLVFGLSYMDEVELAPHDQRDSQRMRECFDAVV